MKLQRLELGNKSNECSVILPLSEGSISDDLTHVKFTFIYPGDWSQDKISRYVSKFVQSGWPNRLISAFELAAPQRCDDYSKTPVLCEIALVTRKEAEMAPGL